LRSSIAPRVRERVDQLRLLVRPEQPRLAQLARICPFDQTIAALLSQATRLVTIQPPRHEGDSLATCGTVYLSAIVEHDDGMRTAA
jgi:hypothetical protein